MIKSTIFLKLIAGALSVGCAALVALTTPAWAQEPEGDVTGPLVQNGDAFIARAEENSDLSPENEKEAEKLKRKWNELRNQQIELRKQQIELNKQMATLAKELRELGVKSPSMVSKSLAWLAIAKELGIPLARERAPGTARTRKAGKVGVEIGVEQASVAAADEADPHVLMMREEREKTLRGIRRLPKDKAEPILQKYEAGEITDTQARKSVLALLKEG